MALRVNPASLRLARKARREPTSPEHRLWQALRGSQLGGFKFRRQAVIEPYRVDFLCPPIGLVVEVDGDTHVFSGDRDRDRSLLLARLGYVVIRFTNAEVMGNLDGVLQAILLKAQSLPVRSWNLGREQMGSTHPLTPSLRREGGR